MKPKSQHQDQEQELKTAIATITGDTRPFKTTMSLKPRSLKVIESDTIRWPTYGFLLPSHSNFVSKMHRFRDMMTYWLKIAEKTYPTVIWYVPLG